MWALLAAAPAVAQEIANPEDVGRYRFGPIRFTPAVTITNFGVDTNVFNAPVNPRQDFTTTCRGGDTKRFKEPVNPKQDFTITFGPKVDVYTRLGRGLLSGQVGLDYF